MIRWVLAAGLLSSALVRAQGSEPDETNDAVRNALQSSAPTFVQRLHQVTDPLVGLPYRLSPLGEGGGPDTDPRLRYDLFDCLTFVETAMAMAASREPDEVLGRLDAIRYINGEVTLESRNHVMESQWIPHNRSAGWMRDIAPELAGSQVRVVTKVFDDKLFQRMKPGAVPCAADRLPRGRYSLNVVPLEVLEQALSRLPQGALLAVVRGEDAGLASMVSHVGLHFRSERGSILRHAAGKPFHRVVDEPLLSFIARNRRYTKRPVRGVAVFELRRPPEIQIPPSVGETR